MATTNEMRERLAAWLGLSEEQVRELEEYAERPSCHPTLAEVTSADMYFYVRHLENECREVEERRRQAYRELDIWKGIMRRFELYGVPPERTVVELFQKHEP
jgi:hypothetical protein